MAASWLGDATLRMTERWTEKHLLHGCKCLHVLHSRANSSCWWADVCLSAYFQVIQPVIGSAGGHMYSFFINASYALMV